MPYCRGTAKQEKSGQEWFLNIYNFLEQNPQVTEIKINFESISINIPISEYSKYIFKEISYGEKSLKKIFNKIRKKLSDNISDKKLLLETKKLLIPLIDCHMILLRDSSIEPFTINE